MSDSGSSERRQGKVARLIEKRDLDGLGDRLERRWTADGDERMSLRDLAQEFNCEILRSAMVCAGMQPLDGDLQTIYRRLTDEDISGGDRTRTERQLDREGIDVDQLRDDFVTYQAIRTYLRDHRNATYSGDTRDQTEAATEHIQRLRGRVQGVTESKLEQLRQTENIDLGSFRTLVEINVLCTDCGSKYDVEALLRNGGCDCGPTDD